MSVAVVIGGKSYVSQSEAARLLGRSVDAIRRAVKSGRDLIHHERPHGAVSRLARERGLDPHTVHNRIGQGATLEEALTKPAWAELPTIAARVGPRSRLIRDAVASGMTLERALLEMPLRDRRVVQ